MARWLATLLVVLLSSGGAARHASAAPSQGSVPKGPGPRVAISSLTLLGDPALGAAHAQVYLALRGGLTDAGLTVLAPHEVERGLALHPGLAGCELPRCLVQIGEILDVPLCAQLRSSSEAGSLRVTVELTFAASGKVASRVSAQCKACDFEAALAFVRQLAAKAGQEAHRAWVVSPPPRRRAAGHSADPPGKGTTRTRLIRGPAWAMSSGIAFLAVGVATLVPGAVLLGLHGETTSACGSLPLNRQCSLDTRTGGIALTVTGVAAITAGAALLAFGLARRAEGPVVLLGAEPGGASLSLWGRF